MKEISKIKDLNIGIVGLGYMGLHHLKLLNQMIKDDFIQGASIDKICDPDGNHLKQVSDKYEIPSCTEDPGEVLLDDKINTVFIASPTMFHQDQAEMAIKSGKSIYCEKPLGLNSRESIDLANLVERLKIPNQVGLVLRSSPSCSFIKNVLESKEIGSPLFVNYRHDAFFPFGGIYRGDWKNDIKTSGGGILKEACVHDIDLLSYFFGDYSIGPVKIKRNEVGIDTYVGAEFNSGDTRILFNTLWHNIEGRGTSRRIEIYCEKGMLVTDDFLFEGDVTYQETGKEPIILSKKELFNKFREENRLDNNFKRYRSWYSSIADHSFIKNIQSGENCYPSFRVAADADKKVDEIYDRGKD